jgi:hypothetical protein
VVFRLKVLSWVIAHLLIGLVLAVWYAYGRQLDAEDGLAVLYHAPARQ